MNYVNYYRKANEEYTERLALVCERLEEIIKDCEIKAPFDAYFKSVAEMILVLREVGEGVCKDPQFTAGEQGRKYMERIFVQELYKDNYEKNFLNPAYAVKELGKEYGQVLSALACLIRRSINPCYRGSLSMLCMSAELVVEVYVLMLDEDATAEKVIEVISSYMHDNVEHVTEMIVQNRFSKETDFARSILMESDLSNCDYLYRYGEYINENQLRIYDFLSKMPQEQLQQMADTYTEGFRLGFIACNKPLEKKTIVEVRYPMGFEPMVRLAVKNFEKMNLYAYCVPNQEQTNKQYGFDHEKDCALWMDKSYLERFEEFYRKSLEEVKDIAPGYAGPAVIETFGENAFEPVNKEEKLKLDKKQQGLFAQWMSMQVQTLYEYIHGDERSFTIIAYPIPEIGDQFEEIFAETVKVNNLDYVKYQTMQQKLIDVLDQADYVHVLGKGENKTDLKVKIYELSDPAKQTAFENCVADVNIPVGEVFTSPVLEGTNGKLHVTQVYLEGRNFLNLEFDFKDGMVTTYNCTNFEKDEDNKRYIEDNILHNHPTLPIGEFAIGTNTTAYRMGIEYDIQAKLPILIAEKTGPHFAVGDTCYSYDEDNETFNADGKAIVARENSISALRKTDMAKAYFNCHTDITIPYNELDSITVYKKDGSTIPVIENGHFVVPGTEELNIPLEGLF